MTREEELRKELSAIEVSKKQVNWDIYLKRIRLFLEKIDNKTIIATNNGSFYMFKVLGYNDIYPGSGSGKFDDWNDKRYFEIKTTGYLRFVVPDSNGKTYWFSPPRVTATNNEPGIHVPYGAQRLIKIKGKNRQTIIFPTFDFSDAPLRNSCLSNLINIVSIGKICYDKGIPNYDEALNNFMSNCMICEDEEVFGKALELHKKHVLETLDFYENFKPVLRGTEYLSDTFKGCTVTDGI